MIELRISSEGFAGTKSLAAVLAILARELTTQQGNARFGVMFFNDERSNTMGEITVKDTAGPIEAAVTFLDAHGAATTPDTVPVWTSSDETVATVAAADDGLSATITVGQPGVTIIEAAEQETVEETGATSTVAAQGTVTVQPADAVIGSVEFTPAAAPAEPV